MPTTLRPRITLASSLAAILLSLAATPAHATELVQVDDWGGRAPRQPDQIEVEVLSSRAATVTGGDALVAIRGLAPDDTLTVLIGGPGMSSDGTIETLGRDVTAAFAPAVDGETTGLISGLAVGHNDVAVIAEGPSGRRTATLPVRNHPITGPVFSGPHQEPFICRTVDAGLGEPLDDDCSVETAVEWRYWSRVTNGFRPLDDPYAPYPPDTATTTTTEGTTVPYVVRIESSTINRGITRIAVLDDPAARGAHAPYAPTDGWNRKVLFEWGQSCGVGFHQGVNTIEAVLSADHYVRELGDQGTDGAVAVTPPVAQGYVVAHSTHTTLGVHCNQVLSAETFMMIREHISEDYGLPEFVMGTGASGGAIQQLTTGNMYPGLLDGAIPMVSFPDVVTTAMSPADCRLLLDVFHSDPVLWNEATIQAVTGHRTSQICRDWDLLFAKHLEAASGCDGSIPPELVYDPETNRDGVRCTLQDQLVNFLGVDPETGFARRPLDNVGVQYGLGALNAGRITTRMFLDLNREIGGFDIDGNIVDERMSMPDDLARDLYELGFVTGRGAIDELPILHVNTYIDWMPVLGFHDQVRAYMLRDRLDRVKGGHDAQAIWNGAPVPNDAWPVMDDWLSGIPAAPADRAAAVVEAKPALATDRCTLPLGVGVDAEADRDEGSCERVFTPLGSPRIVAGGPLSEDVVKCRLKPLDPADYAVALTEVEWAELEAIFPDGVCDWSRPGVGEVPASVTWRSWGGDELAAPHGIPNVVARSDATILGIQLTADRSALPATGGGLGLVGVACVGLALALRRRVDPGGG